MAESEEHKERLKRLTTDDFTPAKTLEADRQTLLLYSGSAVEGDVVTDRSGNGNHGRVVRSRK